MIFQHTLDKVLSGEKTMTRRLAKPEPDGTTSIGSEMIQWPNGVKSVMRGTGQKWYKKWQVGAEYAVQPGRGKPAVARIRITDLRGQDVRWITPEDACAEGFVSNTHFMLLWTQMHDPKHYDRYPTTGQQSLAWGNGVLSARPVELYTAWVITFELVKP